MSTQQSAVPQIPANQAAGPEQNIPAIRNQADLLVAEAQYLASNNVPVDQATWADIRDPVAFPNWQSEHAQTIMNAALSLQNKQESDQASCVKFIRDGKFSPRAWEIASWKLLLAIEEAQRGHCHIPACNSAAGIPKYQEFDTFAARFNEIVEILDQSKATAINMLKEDIFKHRLAWCPGKEGSRKKNNKRLNDRRLANTRQQDQGGTPGSEQQQGQAGTGQGRPQGQAASASGSAGPRRTRTHSEAAENEDGEDEQEPSPKRRRTGSSEEQSHDDDDDARPVNHRGPTTLLLPAQSPQSHHPSSIHLQQPVEEDDDNNQAGQHENRSLHHEPGSGPHPSSPSQTQTQTQAQSVQQPQPQPPQPQQQFDALNHFINLPRNATQEERDEAYDLMTPEQIVEAEIRLFGAPLDLG